jgi:hypothetical protein
MTNKALVRGQTGIPMLPSTIQYEDKAVDCVVQVNYQENLGYVIYDNICYSTTFPTTAQAVGDAITGLSRVEGKKVIVRILDSDNNCLLDISDLIASESKDSYSRLSTSKINWLFVQHKAISVRSHVNTYSGAHNSHVPSDWSYFAILSDGKEIRIDEYQYRQLQEKLPTSYSGRENPGGYSW